MVDRDPDDLWGWEAKAWRDDAGHEQTAAPLRLSEEERAVFRREAVRSLVRAISVQIAVSVVVTMLAWAVSGSSAGWSALAGAAACFIPNALFAFRLILSAHKPEGTNPAVFLLGEFFKIAAAAALIVTAARYGHGVLVWPAFIAGIIGALKSQWLLLAFGKNF